MVTSMVTNGDGDVTDPPTETKILKRDEVSDVVPRESDCVAIIHARDATLLGKRVQVGSGEVIVGRGSSVGLDLNSEAVSRRHASIRIEGRGYVVEDLGSTNGTYVNERRIARPTHLRRGDQIKIGDTILKFLTGDDVENQYHETFRRLAMHDELTGAYNKRFFSERLAAETKRAERYERPLSLVLFDIDHFKRVNDEHGHLAGDAILSELVTRASGSIRPTDVLARYGGEEFAILLTDTPIEGASAVAEKIRAIIEARPFTFEGTRIAVTSSFGVAAFERGMTDEALIKLADDRLYQAKREGRNQVVAA